MSRFRLFLAISRGIVTTDSVMRTWSQGFRSFLPLSAGQIEGCGSQVGMFAQGLVNMVLGGSLGFKLDESADPAYSRRQFDPV